MAQELKHVFGTIVGGKPTNGSGNFDVVSQERGVYTIIFHKEFENPPTITLGIVVEQNFEKIYQLLAIIVQDKITKKQFEINTFEVGMDLPAALINADFCFHAVGYGN